MPWDVLQFVVHVLKLPASRCQLQAVNPPPPPHPTPCRYPIDYESPKNAGLKPTILALKELQQRHPKITWADLATLGASVAVEAAGGESCSAQAGIVR